MEEDATTQLATVSVCQGEIISHQVESPRYRRLKMHAPDVATVARAGQFIHVLTRNQLSCDPLLRRAFSIMKVEGESIEILYRVEGKGTSLLSEKRVGERVDFIGPLGKCFAPAPRQVFLVGGGVGVPPLLMLAKQIAGLNGSDLGNFEKRAGENQGNDIRAIIGARTREDVLCVSDFEECGVEVEVATDDGSLGAQGRVTNLLDEHFNSMEEVEPFEKFSQMKIEGQSDQLCFRPDLMVYTCGPLPMLRAVALLCARFGVRCQVSLEENMPCGIGVCNGCMVPAAQADDEYSMYKRICVEGPVMWAHEVKW